MSGNVEYARGDGISTVTIARPEKLNALTPAMWAGITEGIHRAEDDDVDVVVVTGEGDAFCAGDDIRALYDIEDNADVRDLTEVILECFETIETSRLPVVGRANGSAYGGGFELLLAMDLTVAPEGATFSLPETAIGAFPFYGAKRLTRLVGRQRAADIAMAGREITAAEAHDWGLFARAVPPEDLNRTVDELCRQLRRSSPSSLEVTKSWLTAGLEFPGEDAAMRTGLGYLFAGPDAHEGAASFLEDREPAYRGD